MADLLTAIRLLLVAPFALALAGTLAIPPVGLWIMLAVAVATDLLDGRVARKRGTASPRGQLFDHATDFLFVTCGLAGAAWANQVPWLLPALIALAFSQYVLDSYLLYRQKALRMSKLGRWNGIFYFVPLLLVVISRTPMSGGLLEGVLMLLALVCLALIVSTLLSILDRALAPMRKEQKEQLPGPIGARAAELSD